jgi:hypothetical protein
VKGPRRVRIPRQQSPLAPPSSTLPAQPSISMGGVIVCTSTTRPLAVDGQLIFETNTRRLLQYEAALTDWVPPRGVGYMASSASPPAHSFDGEVWFQTDTRLLVVRDVSSAAWLPVRGMVTPCTSATRPASPYEGQPIYETDTDRLLTTRRRRPAGSRRGTCRGARWHAPPRPRRPRGSRPMSTSSPPRGRRSRTAATALTFFARAAQITSAGEVFGKITDNTPTQLAVDQKTVAAGSGCSRCHVQTVVTAAATASSPTGAGLVQRRVDHVAGAATMPHSSSSKTSDPQEHPHEPALRLDRLVDRRPGQHPRRRRCRRRAGPPRRHRLLAQGVRRDRLQGPRLPPPAAGRPRTATRGGTTGCPPGKISTASSATSATPSATSPR